MKTPNKLEQNVVELILPRLQDEFDAFAFYRSASNWCKNAGYEFAASYFDKESNDELTHAKGLEDYLASWNVIPELPSVSRPEVNFDGLVDVISQAYDIEFSLYELYEDTAKKMFSADLCTFALMQKYLNIQLASVAEYSDLLNQLALIDSKDKFQLFYFEKRAFKK